MDMTRYHGYDKSLRTKVLAFVFGLSAVFASAVSASGGGENHTVSGTVRDSEGLPVEAAVVLITSTDQWAVSSDRGEFVIRNVAAGKTTVEVSCLGYATVKRELDIQGDKTGLEFILPADNLMLDQVVITAQENSNSATTSHTIDRAAMEHMQMMDVSGLMGLLPGGRTTDPDLASASPQRFEIRSGGEAHASFGTAVEVDGVRLSNNAAFDETAGTSTRNLSSANIESVEVITGVPSVEYGDMTNGIVRIKSRQGASPWMFTFTTNPRTKQFSLTKGLDLGKRRGILNLNLERTKAVTNLASPYSSYDRNNLSLSWSNTFNTSGRPLRLTVGFTGNIGGSDTKADPDADSDSYSETRDNVLRANFSIDWLLNASWITNLEISGSVNYSDRLNEVYALKSAASSVSAQHGTEEGYFVATEYDTDPDAAVTLIPPGSWYERAFTDSKPLDYDFGIKADWSRKFGPVQNRLKVGADFTGSGNLGRGLYYEDMRYAPAWREYRYDEIPFMNNLAFYAEESITVPIASTSLNIVAGIRSEHTMVQNSEYGNVSSLSPRFNLKYTILPESRDRFVRHLAVRGSWGKATKLPSFNILYPEPSYEDIMTFAPATTVTGNTFYAYYIKPHTLLYNPGLEWQYSHLAEVGADLNLGGVRIALSAYYNRSFKSYVTRTRYDAYSYNFTGQTALEGIAIPSTDRIYSVDRETGIVTVSDRTGVHGDIVLDHQVRESYMAETYADNGAPVTRKGVEWTVDFGQIRAVRTSIRLDGSYYHYRTVDEQIEPYWPGGTMSDGSPYRYIGYFVGGRNAANGRVSEDVTANLTFTTHIPKVRMIFSLRVETGLYSFSRSLSEWSGGQRSYAVERGQNTPGDTDIYDKNKYVITYPLYYTSIDNPEPQPFLEKYLWALENDADLANQLGKMIVRSGYGYSFNARRISPYFGANISVTKEIGDIASVSFYANNFFNNLGKVKSTQNDNEISLFGSSYIPSYYYGLTVRVKF